MGDESDHLAMWHDIEQGAEMFDEQMRELAETRCAQRLRRQKHRRRALPASPGKGAE